MKVIPPTLLPQLYLLTTGTDTNMEKSQKTTALNNLPKERFTDEKNVPDKLSLPNFLNDQWS